MVAVDRLGLLDIKASRVRIHVLNVEDLRHLGEAEHVAVGRNRPAEQREVVEQSLGNEPAVAVVKQVRLGVALRQLLVALPHHVWQVAETWDVRGNASVDHRVVQRDLARRR
ncbi:unannotated protein [freshwater metagenome]|uniref:Unannotated protein n=1 Tax=freshwater metagenome TaxID=449393 RepID=A0A6J6CXN0_9ZZZZ